MNATKRAQVPFGLRKKLMAATSMLLVAAIMLVSTSYAWFTLSTAPEITGITTSVGANGNLEIALLTTETFNNTDAISSGTQDSLAVAEPEIANATWGNLIDLSDSYYGLDQIVLYPSALNLTENTVGMAPLSVPVYGSDGRVTKTEAKTITAIAGEGSLFTQSTDGTDYGVRAVGTSAAVSGRALILRSAQGMFKTKAGAVSAPIKNAVINNITPFLMLAAQGGAPASYSYDQVKAMKDIAIGVRTSLENIVAAYSYAAIATLAVTDSVDDDFVDAANTTIAGKTDAATILGVLSGDNYDAAESSYTTALTDLQTQQEKVGEVITSLTDLLDGKTKDDTFGADTGKAVIDAAIKSLLGDGLPIKAADNTDVGKDNIFEVGNIYLTGGVVGEKIPAYSGTFYITEEMDVSVNAGAYNTAGSLTGVGEIVGGYTYQNTGNTAVSITDFYGYIIDFAFRTNAADSYLQLQTAAVNRVYSDAQDVALATQGGGSIITYDFSSVEDFTATQAKNLLEAVRVVFFNPDGGSRYATAKVGNVTTSDSVATGELYLIDTTIEAYELGKEAYTGSSYAVLEEYTAANTISGDAVGSYKATITAEQYAQLEPKTSGEGTEESKYTLGKDAYEASEYTLNAVLSYGETTITKDQCTNAITTIVPEMYNALKSRTTKTTDTTLQADKAKIVDLSQNIVQKVSALVYLDGENIDNSAVAAKGTSGDMKLNLQFSSSAALTPMENSALRTELKNAGTNP